MRIAERALWHVLIVLFPEVVLSGFPMDSKRSSSIETLDNKSCEQVPSKNYLLLNKERKQNENR